MWILLTLCVCRFFVWPGGSEAARYPNVSLEFITDCGHYPMHETPVYLATLLQKFVDTNS